MKIFQILIFLSLTKILISQLTPIIINDNYKWEFTNIFFAYPSDDEFEMFCKTQYFTEPGYYYKYYKDDLIECKEIVLNDENDIKYKFYLNSKEYFKSTSSAYYYIKNDKTYKINNKFDNIYIFKNKTFVFYKGNNPLLFELHNYPPDLTCELFYDCTLEPSKRGESRYNYQDWNHVTVERFSDDIFVFAYSNKYELIKIYILDDNFNLKHIQEINNPGKGFLKIINLDNYIKENIICIENQNNYECFLTKYENRFIFGESLVLISDRTHSDSITAELINKNQIVVVSMREKFSPSKGRYHYISNFIVNNGKLEFGEYKEKKFYINLEDDTYVNLVKITYTEDKGIILLFNSYQKILENYSYKIINPKIFKIYIKDVCFPFELHNIKIFEKVLINFEEHISRGIDKKNDNIKIISLDKRIKLYKDNIQIFEGNLINIKDKIFAVCEDSFEGLKIIFQFGDVTCSAYLYTEINYINIMDESYRCLIESNNVKINNILYHDLKDNIYDVLLKKFSFNIIFENEIKNKEKEIYSFNNALLTCNIDKKNKNKLFCKGDLPVYSKKFYTKKYYISSKLSCTNSINISEIKLRDKYLLNIYEAENLEELIKNLNPFYDPKERIQNFSVNMITYYYWFSGFSYCDDYYISKQFCCENEILNDWKIIKHLDYRMPYPNIRFEKELLKLLDPRFYAYNFAILKSDKYKKFIFTFPGTTSLFQLVLEIFGVNMTTIDSTEPLIGVESFFFALFEMIYKDLFSDEIIGDLKLNSDYQIIFTGHSLGGALATLSSYYYANKNLAQNEPVLITFGQPRVGNELFARKFMKLIPLVFRIARKGDVVTMIPPALSKVRNDLINTRISPFLYIYNIISNLITSKIENNENYDDEKKMEIINYIAKNLDYDHWFYVGDYCHIGGLYILNEKTFYQCADLYNEENAHPICHNSDYNEVPRNFLKVLDYHGYLKYGEDLLKKCQYFKILQILPIT